MTIMRISYGANTAEYNQSLVKDADAYVQRYLEVLQPGRLWVSIFPWMRYIPAWFPGAGWKNYLKKIAELKDKVVTRPWSDTQDRVVSVIVEFLSQTSETIQGKRRIFGACD
jgi:hypothetical protein